MNILGVDTSTKKLSVCVLKDDLILANFNSTALQRHSSMLVPVIEKVLKKSKLPLKDIDGFAISIGPGSFTGLRIGVSSIKALSMATGKPIVAVPSLDVLARNATSTRDLICPIVDAKKSNVYACFYRPSKGKLIRLAEYMLSSVHDVAARTQEKTVFLGDGLAVYGDYLKNRLSSFAVFEEERLWYPKAVIVAKLGLEKLKGKEFDDTDRLTPLYLYPKECDIIKKQK